MNITNRTKNSQNYEKIKEVKAYSVTMPCSKCDGEMEFTGSSYMTIPLYNIHKCNKCGCIEEFSDAIYPRIECENISVWMRDDGRKIVYEKT